MLHQYPNPLSPSEPCTCSLACELWPFHSTLQEQVIWEIPRMNMTVAHTAPMTSLCVPCVWNSNFGQGRETRVTKSASFISCAILFLPTNYQHLATSNLLYDCHRKQYHATTSGPLALPEHWRNQCMYILPFNANTHPSIHALHAHTLSLLFVFVFCFLFAY